MNNRQFKRPQRGFTLIELLMVVAIIAILLTIAVPSYQEYIRRATRTEAGNAMMRIASEQEKFFTTFNRYSSTITGARTGNPATSGLNMLATTSDGGGDQRFYLITLALTAANLRYTLTATPQSDQVYDKCGTMTLNERGVRTGAVANCW